MRRLPWTDRLEFVSLIDMLCDGAGCYTYVPGSESDLMTWDYGHMTTAGAATHGEIERTRRGKAVNEWRFGDEVVRTKVFVLVPERVTRVDVGLTKLRASKDGRPAGDGRSEDVAALLEDR